MKLFEIADQYCKKSNWKTFALVKICLFAIGLMAGMQIPKEKKKTVLWIGCLAFLTTYIPLMSRFIHLWFYGESQEV